MCANFQAKWKTLTFFGPNLPKNGFWDWNFKNLNADLESACPRYHVCQFLRKTNKFEFSTQTWGNFPITYFGSNNVEGVAKNLLGAEMSWVEVGGWFSNTLKFINYTSRATLWQKDSFVAEVTFKNCSIDFIV